MRTDHGYIAACELCSPNAPEFERVLETQRDKQMNLVIAELRKMLNNALNEGRIDNSRFYAVDNELSSFADH